MSIDSKKVKKRLRLKYRAVGGKKKPQHPGMSRDCWVELMVERDYLKIRLVPLELSVRQLKQLVHHIEKFLEIEGGGTQ